MRNLIKYGLLVLLIQVGNKLGSDFGMGVAFCVFMIIEGLIEEFKKKPRKNITKKEEVK